MDYILESINFDYPVRLTTYGAGSDRQQITQMILSNRDHFFNRL